MVSLKINNIEIKTDKGATLLEAITAAGFDVPAMCNFKGLENFTSCMICVVKDKMSGTLIPSCAAKAQNGMDIITDDEEIYEARKTALELLLSEHAGDCEAPCRIACPAFMNIPLMNRHIQSGNIKSAYDTVIKDIALPRILGRICPAPCESACKRKATGQPVSICILKRFAADNCIDKNIPSKTKDIGKCVAIIGAGPAGLAAAFYLQTKGIKTDVFDSNEKPGGSLRYDISDEILDKQVLDDEIGFIKSTGATLHQNKNIDLNGFEELRKKYDALIIATGNYSDKLNSWGLENDGEKLAVDKTTYLTNIDRVFAIGNVNRPGKLAIRSLTQGKKVAEIISGFFTEGIIKGKTRRFNSVIGKLIYEEFNEYLKEATSDERYEPVQKGSGFTNEIALREAARCMHCDCRKPDNCKLRYYSTEYSAKGKRFAYTQRKPVKKLLQQDLIVYEPGKCIKCGICVRLTAKEKERFGFTFIGRGFDVEVGIPFGKDMEKALETTAHKVAEACPTGALALIS